jgi:tetratricopeptide (TPR) repeat protein
LLRYIVALASLVAAIVLIAPRGAAPARGEEAPRFVGSASCALCHQSAFTAWSASHHARAMQQATDATVLGHFAGAHLDQPGLTSTFFRDGPRRMVRTDGPDGALHDYPIAYTFGVAPLQQYLIGFPGGRYQSLGIAWDSRPAAEGGQRWFPLYTNPAPPAGSPLHWTGYEQTWNLQCADCHATDLRKNFDLATNSYATSFSETGVGCEACHGPGSRHVAWARARQAGGGGGDPAHGLLAWLRATDRGEWVMNPATGIARRTAPPDSSAVLDACAPCHARRSVIATGQNAATPFLDAYLPALLEPGLYHADGQIDGEVYEYGSFVQSRMFQAGVTCINCHDPHAGGRVAEGNALCAQCHLPARFDTAAHHHHQDGGAGAQCAACHMPAKTYMGVDQRRDHSFRVPRPDLTLAIGVPNTCNQCHADKTAAWAADMVARWFPGGRQTTPHYGLALAAGRAGQADAEGRLDALIGDRTAPPIARATALRLLPPYATAASRPVIGAAIADPSPLVRLAAPATLPADAPPDDVRAMAALLADPVRAVRIEAARALAGFDPAPLTEAQRQDLAAALASLRAAEMTDADRPDAHLNLGLLAVRRRMPDEAAAEYATALRLDPGFVPAMVNLADLDRMRGLDAQGIALLRRAAALAPASADVHHALGLLLVRQHDTAGALAELRQANALAPENARYAYVYAIALNGTGAPREALALLQATHRRHPADRDVLAALIPIALDQGDRDEALGYAKALSALDPADPRTRRLVEELGH